MILRSLQTLISDTDALIKFTQEDIAYIKAAQHDKVNKNHLAKEVLVRKFESNKSLLNHGLLEITQKNPSKTLEDILTDEEQSSLMLFKQKLSTLHAINKEYTKFVAALSEFFDTMLSEMFLMKTEGYKMTSPQPAAFLQVSA